MKNPIREEVETLCQSCRWSGIIQFGGRNNRLIRCEQLGRDVRARVETCTYWLGKGQMTKYEMEASAWIVKTSGSVIGFIRPGTKEHEEALGSPNHPHPAR